MAPVLARLGHLEARVAVQTPWRCGKRKRQEWTCSDCRRKQQSRAYADDAKVTVGDHLFPPNERQQEVPHEADAPQVRRQWIGPERGKAQTTQRGTFDPSSESDRAKYFSANPTIATNEQWPTWESQNEGQTAGHESDQDALWEQFAQIDDTTDTVEAVPDQSTRQTEATAETPAMRVQRGPSLLDIDYAALLPGAVQNREADLTARCLFAASRYDDLAFIRAIPPATFSDIIKILEPANSINKLASVYRGFNEGMQKLLGIAPLDKIAYEYSQLLRKAISIRRAAGQSLTLQDIHVLLRGARDLGNKYLSKQFWEDLHAAGHTPDVESYNYYMAGHIFHGLHSAGASYRLRVIPFNVMARKTNRLGGKYESYRIGLGGVRDAVLATFRDMLKNGAVANEESFRIIIMAAAREGDLGTVKSVLRNVWAIDVNALLAGRAEEEILPKRLAEDSPLRPTEKLLFTVAHAFGINNAIPTALRLVDFIARQYELRVELETWAQLLEWTFVLAVPRTSSTAHTDGTMAGKLPLQAVPSLWDTMTGPPYHVQPTIEMYNYMIKALFYLNWCRPLIEKMEEGRELSRQSISEALRALDALKEGIRSSQGFLEEAKQKAGFEEVARHAKRDEKSLEQLRSEFEYADLIRKRDHFLLKRWLRLLLAALRSYSVFDPTGHIPFRRIPSILHTWKLFAPTTVRYDIPGGLVEFRLRTQEEIDASALLKAERKQSEGHWLAKVPRFVGGEWYRVPQPLLPKRFHGGPEAAMQTSQRTTRPEDMDIPEGEAAASDAVGDENTEAREAVNEALDWRQQSPLPIAPT